MAVAQASTASTVPQLMRTVKQLSPAELREFQRSFSQWQQENGGREEEEATLIQVCKARLPAADESRLNKLIAKSERGTLTPKELAAYRTLVSRAERLDTTRLAALALLARRWHRPVRLIMETIGWEGGKDDVASDPARAAKAGARSRR
jgi:hypothetical protein